MTRAPAVVVLLSLAGCFYGKGSYIGGVTGGVVGGFSGAVLADDDKPLAIGAGVVIGYAIGSCLGFVIQWVKETEPAPTSDDDSGIKRVSGSGDEDHDGIINRLDACVGSPEDRDGVDDRDGCPEVGLPGDRDEDAVPDTADKCPDDVGETGAADGCPVLPPPVSPPPPP